MKSKRIVLLALVVLSSAGLLAQTALTSTTLSAAVNASVSVMPLTSVTGATGVSVTGAGSILYINREAMIVQSVNSTAVTATVIRGQFGTPQTAHTSGAVVLIGTPSQFANGAPSGACTAANTGTTPYVDMNTGNQWLCSTVTLSWVPGWGNPGNSASPIAPTAAVASAAGVIVPSGPLFHVTGTEAITGFTIPVGYNGGPFCIIPDAAFTTTNAGNIAIASTGVASKQLCYSYDPKASKPFFPSY